MSVRRLAFAAIVVAYGLIVFGGFVASSKSGMGCGPDWPLCNGAVVPSLQGATLIEFTHRIIGALLFITTITLVIRVLRKDGRPIVRSAAYLAIGFLVVEVIFGAFIVLYELPVSSPFTCWSPWPSFSR